MYIHNKRIFDEDSDLNPMDFVSNLSDVMLVLAVGIMLALVSAFHVNLTGEQQGAYAPAALAGDIKIEIPLNEAQNAGQISKEQLTEAGFSEFGTVYQDVDGNLYVLGVADEE